MIKIKIAVLSDIHGNYIALEEVLKDCKKENVDEYLVLGDMVCDLPFGNKTLEIVKSLNAKILKGNKEQYIIEYDEEKYDWNNIQFRPTIYMYNELSRENIEFIKSLPHKMDLEYENVRLTIAHGSPKSVEEKIKKTDIKTKEYYAKNMQSDILLFGHTHEKAWIEKINGKILVSCGCLGVSPHYIGKAEYVILDIENGKINNIDLRLVDYDIEKVKQAILDDGILNLEKIFMNLTYCGINGNGRIRHEFFKDGKEMMLARYGKIHKNNAKGIYTYFMLFDDDIWLSLGEKYRDYFVFK